VLPIKVVIEARNSQGPVASITIAVGVESPGGGSVTPQSATTDAQGTAQFTWTLGSKIGTQTLTAGTTGATPVHATLNATATQGAATIIQPTSEVSQFVPVGTVVPSPPTVLVTDASGNPKAGTAVTFEALQGGNVLTGTDRITNAAGVATIGSWTIGPDAVIYSVRGTIANGAVALFEAKGIPASFTAFAGAGQTANAGTALPVLPAVRAARADGSPLPNVPVEFTVTEGGGSVTGSTALTAADGTARPARWVLGIVPGSNSLEGRTAGRPAVLFSATGAAAVPASAVAVSSTSFSGFFGNYLLAKPEISVRDAQGNPVAGVAVAFQVAQGAGQVQGFSSQTDFQGHASALSWRLGASGSQSLTATVGALAPITFTATGSAPPPSTFKIEIRYPNAQPTVAQKAAFDGAVARWTELLVAGAPPYTVVPTDADPSGECPSMLGEVVDGLVIYANLGPIDGPGRVLGQTGVCVIRDDGFLPVQGLMTFDTADLTDLESRGQVAPVILHEMGHALGFGTIWLVSIPGLGTNAFLTGFPGSDPTFNGPAARAAFYGAVATPTIFTGIPVPIEAGGGPGTAYSHWRETTFTNELMTGFLNAGSTPLSAMTVQQFRDLGYVVNDALADAFTFQAFIQAAVSPSFQLIEAPLTGSITVINKHGGVVARIPRVFQ
jgi:hypothetical protein